MPQPLPTVEVVRTAIDEVFDPHCPVMALRWADHGSADVRLWELPEGMAVLGPPPARFGLSLRRHAADGYAVRVQWERTHLSWPAASRTDLLGSSLAPLLTALGLDLWSLLEQPIPGARPRPRAA